MFQTLITRYIPALWYFLKYLVLFFWFISFSVFLKRLLKIASILEFFSIHDLKHVLANSMLKASTETMFLWLCLVAALSILTSSLSSNCITSDSDSLSKSIFLDTYKTHLLSFQVRSKTKDATFAFIVITTLASASLDATLQH